MERKIRKRKDVNKMTEYQKLLMAEAMEATTIEIVKRDEVGLPI